LFPFLKHPLYRSSRRLALDQLSLSTAEKLPNKQSEAGCSDLAKMSHHAVQLRLFDRLRQNDISNESLTRKDDWPIGSLAVEGRDQKKPRFEVVRQRINPISRSSLVRAAKVQTIGK